MVATKRRFAVIVRAGETSLHRAWLNGQERNWDLIVSWFGAAPYLPGGDEIVLTQPGFKWDVIARQLREHPEIMAQYDYLVIGDDDIEVSVETINRLFEITEQEGLEVSQPGLTANSYFSFIHHLQSPSFQLRYTSLVEVMFPCRSRAALERVLPFAQDTPAGMGLDLVWARLEADNRERAAVIDSRDNGAIQRAMLRRFGIVLPKRSFYCYAGITRSGRRAGAFGTRWRMAWDCLTRMREWSTPRRFGKWWVLFVRSLHVVPVDRVWSHYEGRLRLGDDS